MKPVLAVRQVAHEGLAGLESFFNRLALRFQYVDAVDVPGFEFRPADWAGLVVLGGPMNVDQTEQHPYLADEVRWVRAALDAQLPTLGICLGAQLLAKTLGAKVYPNAVKEIGWYDVQLLPESADDALFAGCPSEQIVFQWHGDTFDLPTGAVQLARSADCAQQAFRFGTSAWGLQFHLEMTASLVADWLRQDGNCCELSELPQIDSTEILRRTPEELPRMNALAEVVFGRFAQRCDAVRNA